MRISIDGVGVVGGFGSGRADLETVLSNGQIILKEAVFETSPGTIKIPAYLANTDALDAFVNKKALRRIDHFSRMALLGACLALKDAGEPDIHPQRIGLAVASGYGATRTTFAFLDSTIRDGDAFASPTLFSNSVHNAAAGYISILLKLCGPSLTVSQFEMSVPSALISACRWLEDDRVDAVLLGAVDEYCDVLGYCHHRYFGQDPGGVMKPMDFHRHSSLPGEGAVFFLLSRESGNPSRYGLIQDVQMGTLGVKPVSFPDDATVIIGADGHLCDGINYETLIGTDHEIACYSSLYGSLPVGFAFDMAVASLSIKNNLRYATPNAKEYQGRLKVIREEKSAGASPLCCFKIGQYGEFGMATLISGQPPTDTYE
ncbi:MAG: beta-ketoacyl synthase chain length factor [Proteobacteria bacterium]|nr:beta-ketoacyl synthase chain length factor [Pseudomonadota bacterium]MBU4472080.1 beta-ketoacyl synthase chain length factor [Pseudomonadota bacterium]MCG2752921.1 beta-ketoacyl synthase chain length factor [Desulfobacteraceae bacterium]